LLFDHENLTQQISLKLAHEAGPHRVELDAGSTTIGKVTVKVEPCPASPITGMSSDGIEILAYLAIRVSKHPCDLVY